MRRPALLALLVVLLLVAPALASPQPTPVCRFCGDQFADAASEIGANATVNESTVIVQVHENGSATWRVRNRLSHGATAFRQHDWRLAAVADALLDPRHGYGLPEDVRFVSARMDGETAVLVYRDPDAATRHAGVLVVDYLHDEGRQPRYYLNADRFTIRGPDGTLVTNDPDSGRVDGRSVTWRGDVSGRLYEAPELQGSPYVVFGPGRSVITDSRTTAALALATLPLFVRGVTAFLLPPGLVFAGVLAATTLVLRRFVPRIGTSGLAGGALGLGTVGVVAPAIFHGVAWVSGPPLFGIAVGGLALDGRVRERLVTTRRQALVAFGVVVATFPVLIGAYATLAPERVDPVGRAVGTTALTLPLAAMLPLGGALANESVVRWYALAVVAFLAIPAAVVDLADPPAGLAGGFFAFLLVGYAVLAPLVGSILMLLGRSLSRNAY